MPNAKLHFGFYPRPLHITTGPISIGPLPDLEQIASDVLASEGIEKDRIYAPPQEVCDFMSGQVSERPYASRVFGLPKTHVIEHADADGEDHLAFHLWSLSFFSGLRLTATEAGFIDATPIKLGKLVDFVPTGKTLARSVELAEAFWQANAAEPRRARRFAAAVHALFLGQSPRNLQFESFVYLYTALDACYALAASLQPPVKRINHTDRVAWMCGLFGMKPPAWADPSAPGGAEIAAIRNDTLHEALFMDAPLGFALHGVGSNQNLTLEMEALTCRLLVALIGGETADYIQTSVNTRQRHGLDLR